MGASGCALRLQKNITLSHLFSLSSSRPWPSYPRVLHRGRKVQRSLWDPLVSCPCASGQELLPPLLPSRLYREANMNNKQAHLEESLFTARAAASGGWGLGAGGQRLGARPVQAAPGRSSFTRNWELAASCHKGWVSAPADACPGPLCYFQLSP